MGFGEAVMAGAMQCMRSSVDEMYRMLLAQVPPPPPLVPLTNPATANSDQREQQGQGWNWTDFFNSSVSVNQQTAASVGVNAEAAVDGVTRLYSFVRDNMPNAQVSTQHRL
jgi:hypothetical protein